MDISSSEDRNRGLHEADQLEDNFQEDYYLYGQQERWDEEPRSLRRFKERSDRRSHFKMRKAIRGRSRANKQGRWPKEEPDR